jgi:hypothetical protein
MNIIANINIDILQCVIIVSGYLITMATSGAIVDFLVGIPKSESLNENPEKANSKTIFDIGTIIGRCENFLTITFILGDAFTGLALIFTAKSIARSENIKKESQVLSGWNISEF